MLIPGRLRSRLIFCVMCLMPQGAHRGRPVAAAPVPRAPASKIAATRSLRLIPAGFGSGRGSVPAKHGPLARIHAGCPGLPGNVSAILGPPAPAVSVAHVVKITTGRTNRRPDKAFMPPSGTTTGAVPDRPGIPGSLQRLRQIVALHACVREVGQRHLQLIA